MLRKPIVGIIGSLTVTQRSMRNSRILFKNRWMS